ncbi:MAG: hypothetical protein QOH86_760 [Sphingomonadales bacterium]|jgi:hypothetical protein|nr:hypothetical protein [Sphingomonadales bacterium]
MRLLPVFAVAALLAAPASTPMAAPPVREKPASATIDPDRFCRRFLEGYREQGEPGNARGNLAYAPPPLAALPPPPPPPPPPSPPASTVTEDLVNSLPQSFASPGNRAGGYIRSPENRERYAANPVSTVQAVADAPV